jgi:Protein kinase domain
VSSSEADIRPENMLGGYRLLRKIGEGGMGVVHVAATSTGDRVAVKILRPQVIGDRDARARLEREVAAMRRVRSPRVAECIDADPWGSMPYVVTRFVPGIPLNEYVTEYGPLSPFRIHAIATGTAEALASVHAAGVLHRDIKPSNVLMERDQPVLIDFGLAMAADQSRLTLSGWLLGTPSYLAPEVVHGGEPTPAVDIHAWAATVAFAATGHSPYGGGPAIAVMDRIRRGEWRLDGVPGSLRRILEPCLSYDPGQRPSATQLCHWLSATPPETATPPPAPSTRPITMPVAAAAPFAVPVPPREAAPPPPAAAHPPPAATPPPPAAAPAQSGLTRAMRIVATVLAGLLLAGAAAVAPYIVTAVVAGLVMVGSATARSRSAWSWPWQALAAVPGAVLGAAMALVVMVALVAALVVLGAQVRETMVVGGGAFALLLRWWPGFDDARDSARRLGAWLILPTPPGAVALVFLAAAASGMIAAALATGPHWWPFDHEPWFGWGWRLG